MTPQQQVVHRQFEASLDLERKQEPVSTALAPIEAQPANSLATVIQWAMQNNATVEQMRELYAFQREVKADQAREAFNRAFSAFKSESIRIVKNVSVSDGPLKGKQYADLFGVVSAVIPALSRHGLSHSWKLTKDEPTWMEVTCTISHELGHSQSFPMGAAPDTGPGRNAIQARASAMSYLERYTFLGATGMAAGGQDDDGSGVQQRDMDTDDYENRCGRISASKTLDELKAVYMESVGIAKNLGDNAAIKKFAELKNIRYKELA